jgi:hypothetical protein
MAAKYIPASSVISPKQHWSLIAVLKDDEGEGGSVLAIGRWDNEPVLAMRWNGSGDTLSPTPIGNPQSRGLPTWFIVPRTYNEAILGTLSADQLTLARNFLPKKSR